MQKALNLHVVHVSSADEHLTATTFNKFCSHFQFLLVAKVATAPSCTDLRYLVINRDYKQFFDHYYLYNQLH